MTDYQHKELASGRWNKFSLIEQLANIGSEVGRAINWRSKNLEYSHDAADRAIELLDLSIDDRKNTKRLGELYRIREMLVDFLYFNNEYNTSDTGWQKYFDAFLYASAVRR